MNRESIPAQMRSAYRWFVPITTRWLDHDVFGHVNNVIYYSWIDTAVNSYLLTHGLLDIAGSPSSASSPKPGAATSAASPIPRR